MHDSFLFTMPLAQMHATTTSAGPAVSAPPPAAETSSTATTSGAATTTGTTASGTQPADAGRASGAGQMIQFGLIAIVFVGFYLFMFRGQKKQEKTRKQMLELMKKGDEVMTIGGLIGRVVSVDEDEVVLKVDESANVKERYKKSAIQQVLTADDKAK